MNDKFKSTNDFHYNHCNVTISRKLIIDKILTNLPSINYDFDKLNIWLKDLLSGSLTLEQQIEFLVKNKIIFGHYYKYRKINPNNILFNHKMFKIDILNPVIVIRDIMNMAQILPNLMNKIQPHEILIVSSNQIADKSIHKFVINFAEENKIPFMIKNTVGTIGNFKTTTKKTYERIADTLNNLDSMYSTNRELFNKSVKKVKSLMKQIVGLNCSNVPKLVISLCSKSDESILNQCFKKSIPTIGLTDTNTIVKAKYSILANDDCISSVAILLNLVKMNLQKSNVKYDKNCENSDIELAKIISNE